MDKRERIRKAAEELAEALIALADEAPATAPAVELLDVETFAARVGGMARSTVYAAIAAGDIRSVKVRGRRVIPASEVERIAAGEQLPGRPQYRGGRVA